MQGLPQIYPYLSSVERAIDAYSGESDSVNTLYTTCLQFANAHSRVEVACFSQVADCVVSKQCRRAEAADPWACSSSHQARVQA